MKSVFNQEHVGMTVYCHKFGTGHIITYKPESFYSVHVEYEAGSVEAYTSAGYLTESCETPSLSFVPWDPPLGWDKPPVPPLKIDTKVIVWNELSPKFNRHFKKWDTEGKICCFSDGTTSFSAQYGGYVNWDYWKLAEKETK